MARTLRWGVGLLLIVSLSIGAFLLLPFRAWLPGGTVADIPLSQVVNGTAFNRLFPEPEKGDQLVFTQEKRGFSEARLKHGGQVKALLAISDVTTTPEARSKFEASERRLQGWPLVEQGQQATAVLVADRFQVKVIGQGDGLEAEQRQALIGQFNLRGLAALKGESASRAALPTGEQPTGNLSAMEPAP
ncbi:hypothetical protein [Synechococcus sp. CCY 9618]|uniref:hypothetical protein n=1 Tax=Synechococcus sp. CCY 9618 TaxID=2815602 RepID=UPI0020B36ED1|nr:hypothetical protein [Synechococcus sp. CCY 9618]